MVLTPALGAGLLSLPVAGDADEPQRNCRTAGIVGPVVGSDGHPAGAGGHQAAQRHGDADATRCGCSTLAPAAGAPLRYSRASELPGMRRAACRFWFNDEPMACADGLTVSALLDPARSAASRARRWRSINRSCRASSGKHHLVQEGDQILLFQVIAGG